MRSVRALLFAAAAYLLAAQLVAGELPPFSETNLTCHRLPINVEPTKYELHLRFSSLDSDVYEGSVNISLKFPKSPKEKLAAWGLKNVPCAMKYKSNTIVLHADKSLEIENITLITQIFPFWTSGMEQKNLKIVGLARDETKQMIAIRVKRGLSASSFGDTGKLSITFKGRMRKGEGGVHSRIYMDGKRVFQHFVSQFQPANARTVFPCFDEPRFRVPFSVRVSYPSWMTAYGNTEVAEVREEGDLRTTRFATTPDIPVHMVAFAIGNFDDPLEMSWTLKRSDQDYWQDGERKRTIRVITARGKRETARFALKVAQDSLKKFEELNADEFPLSKLDIIAIPDPDVGITDGWGLAFVRDTLLWVDDETMDDKRLMAALAIARVVAHQWFGNLISARWWSDLWITEGLAAQLSFEFVESYQPFNGSQYFLHLRLLSSALDEDQAGNLHPLSPSEENLQTSEQINDIFDRLEFMKSASMAQMVKNAIGDENYRKLRLKLIKKHAKETINFEDYKRAVLGYDRDLNWTWHLPALLETFPKYNGVPLFNYCRGTSYNWLRITSFNSSAMPCDRAGYETSPAKQKAAVQVSTIVFNPDVSLKAKSRIIAGAKGSEEFHPGYSLSFDYSELDENPSIATYYRTRYSDDLYDRLQIAIKEHSLHPLDRFQILDDASSLMKAGLIRPERFKSLLDSYADEDHPAVVLVIWRATIIYESSRNETSLESDKAIFDIFRKYGFDVSGDESLLMQSVREIILTWLVERGDKDVVDAAVDAFRKTGGKVALFLRQPVYKAVVLSGSEHVNQLLSHLRETKSYDEQIRLVSALTLSKDTGVLRDVKTWLKSSGLEEETTAPFLKSISAAL